MKTMKYETQLIFVEMICHLIKDKKEKAVWNDRKLSTLYSKAPKTNT